MIKGMIGEERLAELTKVSGVTSVEKEREVKLPPRGSPIQ
jgi:hypothetical protein